jgi:hypothetical protein
MIDQQSAVNETVIDKIKRIISSFIKNNNKDNYRVGRTVAFIIFWLGLLASIIGLGTIIVSAFLMLIEPDTVRTAWGGLQPNYTKWAYIGSLITGVSIMVSGLLSALMGQLAIAIFDMSRKIQSTE